AREIAFKEGTYFLRSDGSSEFRVQPACARRDVGPLVLAAHRRNANGNGVRQEAVVRSQRIEAQDHRRAYASPEFDRRVCSRDSNRARKVPGGHDARRKFWGLLGCGLNSLEALLDQAIGNSLPGLRLEVLEPSRHEREALLEFLHVFL